VPPAVGPEQVAVAVETWEMDAEASADDLALAETTLARLLVKHWRARQANQQPGMAASDSAKQALDLLEPGCPDLVKRCVVQNQQAM